MTCSRVNLFLLVHEGIKWASGISPLILNLLKPTGHVMYHQFNLQQLYALPTLYLCVFYLSENKQ